MDQFKAYLDFCVQEYRRIAMTNQRAQTALRELTEKVTMLHLPSFPPSSLLSPASTTTVASSASSSSSASPSSASSFNTWNKAPLAKKTASVNQYKHPDPIPISSSPSSSNSGDKKDSDESDEDGIDNDRYSCDLRPGFNQCFEAMREMAEANTPYDVVISAFGYNV
jgi:hypothetical protein